jgi:hypothetical protein
MNIDFSKRPPVVDQSKYILDPNSRNRPNQCLYTGSNQGVSINMNKSLVDISSELLNLSGKQFKPQCDNTKLFGCPQNSNQKNYPDCTFKQQFTRLDNPPLISADKQINRFYTPMQSNKPDAFYNNRIGVNTTQMAKDNYNKH